MNHTQKKLFANVLYHLKMKVGFSTGICGRYTAGFGELDNNGYWEYPLDWLAEKKEKEWENISKIHFYMAGKKV